MTDYILKITGIDDLDCSLEFYIEREKSVLLAKEELIRVYSMDKIEYYALIDSKKMGRGHLMCRIHVKRKEEGFDEILRTVVVAGYTGYSLPCMGRGNTISCCGLSVTFENVCELPTGDGVIQYGTIADIKNYSEITEEMLEGQLKEIPVNDKELALNVSKGSRIVVLLPLIWTYLTARKWNGLNTFIPFSNSIMGANGETVVKYKERDYKVYGEFMPVNGVIKISV